MHYLFLSGDHQVIENLVIHYKMNCLFLLECCFGMGKTNWDVNSIIYFDWGLYISKMWLIIVMGMNINYPVVRWYRSILFTWIKYYDTTGFMFMPVTYYIELLLRSLLVISFSIYPLPTFYSKYNQQSGSSLQWTTIKYR